MMATILAEGLCCALGQVELAGTRGSPWPLLTVAVLAAPHRKQLAKYIQDRRWQQFSPPRLNEIHFTGFVHKQWKSEIHSHPNDQEQAGYGHKAEILTWVSQSSKSVLTCRLPKLGLLGQKKVVETGVIFFLWLLDTNAKISTFSKEQLCWKNPHPFFNQTYFLRNLHSFPVVD